MSDNPLNMLADWCSTVPASWSQIALQRARDALIDTLGVAIAGVSEPVVQTILPLTQQWGTGQCQVLASDCSLSAPMAALVNGCAAHALDFDDNFDPAKAHASAVLVPALLATAQQQQASIDQILDAYIVGLQIMGRTGQAVNPYHRNRGWHATATLGTIGAAAACARLLELDVSQTEHAISLSTSYAGGMMSQFGTMSKPLHAGKAASGGLQAAYFAQAGVTAGTRTLHGDKGLRYLMVGPDVEQLADAMQGTAEHGQTMRFDAQSPGKPLLIESSGLKLKRYPNCGSVHRSLDGLLELREQHRIDPQQVERILVRAPATHLANLMYDNPDNDMQARFSLPYNLAVGLLHGDVTLSDFGADRLQDPRVRTVMQRVHSEPVDQMESEFPTEIHIQLRDGTQLSTSVAMPLGSTANPLPADQLWQKFSGCVTPILGADRCDKLQQALKNKNSAQPVARLLQLTCKNNHQDID